MTHIAEIADRLRRLAKRREYDGIYTDAVLCEEAAMLLGPSAAIGAGGQAVASLDDVAARLWKADAEDSGTPASVAAGRTREAFDNQAEELKARWRKFAKAASSALSQPHPADERVVEALKRLREATNRKKVGQPYLVDGSSPQAIIYHAIRALDLSMMRHDMIEDLKAGRVKPASAKEGQ